MPGLVTVLDVVDLGVETVALCPSGVHAEQHLCPILALGAAGAGVDRRDRVRGVVRARKQGGQLQACSTSRSSEVTAAVSSALMSASVSSASSSSIASASSTRSINASYLVTSPARCESFDVIAWPRAGSSHSEGSDVCRSSSAACERLPSMSKELLGGQDALAELAQGFGGLAHVAAESSGHWNASRNARVAAPMTQIQPPSGTTERADARLRLKSKIGYRTVAATVVGSGMVFLDSTVVNVALPKIQDELGADLAGLQWVVTGLPADAGRPPAAGRSARRPQGPASRLLDRPGAVHGCVHPVRRRP